MAKKGKKLLGKTAKNWMSDSPGVLKTKKSKGERRLKKVVKLAKKKKK